MAQRVFLIGFMGAGKTTIGKYVARDMGWTFIDMDQRFEREQGCTISQFFAEKGEAAFRQEETNLLRKLAQEDKVIVSTGGGTPCSDENIKIMRESGEVIYINVEPEILCKRLSTAKANRPLIANKTDEELLSFIEDKLNEREKYYRQASIIVDGDKLPFSSYRFLIEMADNNE
ncbi:MAG: shikimate kinase [Bacteroidia bacterium]|nr:shikimate kinase [Bacteroidia bacterium]